MLLTGHIFRVQVENFTSIENFLVHLSGLSMSFTCHTSDKRKFLNSPNALKNNKPLPGAKSHLFFDYQNGFRSFAMDYYGMNHNLGKHEDISANLTLVLFHNRLSTNLNGFNFSCLLINTTEF